MAMQSPFSPQGIQMLGQFSQQGMAQADRREQARQANQAAALKQQAFQMEQQAAQQQAQQFKQEHALRQQQMQEAINARHASQKQWWSDRQLNSKAYNLQLLLGLGEMTNQANLNALQGSFDLETLATARARIADRRNAISVHRGIGNLATMTSNPVGPFSSPANEQNYWGGHIDQFVQGGGNQYPDSAAMNSPFYPSNTVPGLHRTFMSSLQEAASGGEAGGEGWELDQGGRLVLNDNAQSAVRLALNTAVSAGGSGDDAVGIHAQEHIAERLGRIAENTFNTGLGAPWMKMGDMFEQALDATMFEVAGSTAMFDPDTGEFVPSGDERYIPENFMLTGLPGALVGHMALESQDGVNRAALGDLEELLTGLSPEERKRLTRSSLAGMGLSSEEFTTEEQYAQHVGGIGMANTFLWSPVLKQLDVQLSQPGMYDNMGDIFDSMRAHLPGRVDIRSGGPGESWYGQQQYSSMANGLVDRLATHGALPEGMTEEQRHHAMKMVDAMYIGYLQNVSDPYLGQTGSKAEASAAYHDFKEDFAQMFLTGEHAQIGRMVGSVMAAELGSVSKIYGAGDRGLSSVIKGSDYFGQLNLEEQTKFLGQVKKSDKLISQHYEQMADLVDGHVMTGRSEQLARLSSMAFSTEHLTGTVSRWQQAATPEDARFILNETVETLKDKVGEIQANRFGGEDMDEFVDNHLVGIPTDVISAYVWRSMSGKRGLTGAGYDLTPEEEVLLSDPETRSKLEASPWVDSLVHMANYLEPRREATERERQTQLSGIDRLRDVMSQTTDLQQEGAQRQIDLLEDFMNQGGGETYEEFFGE